MSVKNIFWNINGEKVDKETLVEHTLKYGDFGDILNLFKKIDKEEIRSIWLKTMAWDQRFLKINLMIARIFFDMDVESDYFLGLRHGRFKADISIKKD